MYYKNLVQDLRVQAIVLPYKEVQKVLEKYRVAAEEGSQTNKYEYLLAQLIISSILLLDFDFKFAEQTYKYLVEEPWETHQEGVPFNLKVQLLLVFSAVFNNVKNFSR